ncbi:MAG: hypothetical protein HC772_09300 [Leptolyngbyaceae cyanobacterium CRU_2_3]|nr:hypothetical protein [Leptolyngbyaceae cyanobacterium CRU_2_3]
MERQDDLPKNLSTTPGSESAAEPITVEPAVDPVAVDHLLRSMTQDLKTLQQDLVTQLHQDIRRLQAEKSRLLNDIEKLQNQQQALQSQHEVSLSRQQLAQQQAWAKQLALAMANHLQLVLSQRLSQMSGYPAQAGTNLPQIGRAADLENTQRAIASLDDTVNRTFTALRSDLNSYQSTLSQQINRMQELGQQGEAILEVLVSRISQQLQQEMTKTLTENLTYPSANLAPGIATDSPHQPLVPPSSSSPPSAPFGLAEPPAGAILLPLPLLHPLVPLSRHQRLKKSFQNHPYLQRHRRCPPANYLHFS